MTAAELIEKLGALPPDTEILHWSEGCGCCESGYDKLVLNMGTATDGSRVYSMDAKGWE